MKPKKLYFVKREVYTRNIKEATIAKGRIYEITLAQDKDQPEQEENKKIGFVKNK